MTEATPLSVSYNDSLKFFTSKTFNQDQVKEYMRILEDENVEQVSVIYERRGVAEYIKTKGWINTFDSCGYTPVMAAVKHRAIVTLGDLITVEGVDLDICNDRGYNALHMACYLKKQFDNPIADELVSILLSAGADPDIKDNCGDSARSILTSLGKNKSFYL